MNRNAILAVSIAAASLSFSAWLLGSGIRNKGRSVRRAVIQNDDIADKTLDGARNEHRQRGRQLRFVIQNLDQHTQHKASYRIVPKKATLHATQGCKRFEEALTAARQAPVQWPQVFCSCNVLFFAIAKGSPDAGYGPG